MTSFVQEEFGSPGWDVLLTATRPKKEEFAQVVDEVKRLVANIGKLAIVGSVGKGTNLKGSLEVDLVVIVEGLTVANHANEVRRIKEVIQADKANVMQERGVSPYSIQFKRRTVDIDLLPAAPMCNAPLEFFLGLGNQDERSKMAPMMSIAARDFIHTQAPLFKDMVRIAKMWRDNRRWPKSSHPSSCLLEMVMLSAFRGVESARAQKLLEPSSASAIPDEREQTFQAFLVLLAELNTSTYICHSAMFDEMISRIIMQRADKRKLLLPSGDGPVIVDPTNPTNNLASCLTNWEPLRLAAQQSLKLLNNTSANLLRGYVQKLESRVTALEQQLNSFSEVQDKKMASLSSLAVALSSFSFYFGQKSSPSRVTLQNRQDDKFKTFVTLGPFKFKIENVKKDCKLVVWLVRDHAQFKSFLSAGPANGGRWKVETNLETKRGGDLVYQTVFESIDGTLSDDHPGFYIATRCSHLFNGRDDYMITITVKSFQWQ
mmetsp:Transcript_28797/g.39851  ORF Transcript_28797/g.39851 Transcript_28797/m.39851 type:complete len:488 (+) Transcript_28797:66-1529(+)|eukprot:CAMPEP_0201480328 /NCGR_PEP_ID=MMETSP0151_2-20130828/4823_1 /ASSEMBLY_ACC=CAM_ASM_000257 /TAXON_ID=200890 /ORGANISM="Paramoeba atlantica, Strain 621/1 / CCAP 1560/9" /LENGTH=487 /DNA_ID=CAMNT_0047862141 /DNA_START=60 /DNA_END=1523 /DNA_ORIENTATION=-